MDNKKPHVFKNMGLFSDSNYEALKGRGPDFGYGVAKMVGFENRSGAYSQA